MTPRQITALVTFGIAIFLAICAGISISLEDYGLLALAAGFTLWIVLVVMPGYIPLLVVGLLLPFSLPLPIVWNCPFLLIALGTCILKYWLERGLTAHRNITPISTVHWSFGVFFSWVFLRYCMSPSVPNFLGFGRNVTGFRAWLNYALCFGVLFFTGRFVANRQNLLKLTRWLAGVSVALTIILLAAAFSKSMTVGLILTYLGMYVSEFDNSFLRLVALPQSGLILLSLAMLPHLLNLNRVVWWGVFLLAVAAILGGGNRSGLGMAFVIIITILMLRRKFLACVVASGIIAALCFAVYFAGPTLSRLSHTGFLRAFALVSPELAEVTGGDADMEWREVRWQRAMEEIRKHPIIGEGYGGLENMFDTFNSAQMEEESQEMALATGGVHNGYIASALALGVPAGLFIILIVASQIIVNASRAFKLQKTDPLMGEAHCFLCAHIAAFAMGMFVGSDFNAPIVWFYFGLGILLFRMQIRPKQRPNPTFAIPQTLVPADHGLPVRA
jgi:O-antigen ligase